MQTKNIELSFFAQLKDFFPKKLCIEIESKTTANDLLKKLASLCPGACAIIRYSRVADTNHILAGEDSIDICKTYFVLPPSNG